MEKYAIIIDTVKNTNPEDDLAKIPFPKNPEENLDFFYKEIDCETIDVAIPYYLRQTNPDMENVVMVVDDEYLYTKANKLNLPASLMYGVLGHGHPIMGKVLLVKGSGERLEGFTDEECSNIARAYYRCINKAKADAFKGGF